MKINDEVISELDVELNSSKTLVIIADEGYKIILVKVNSIETELNNGVLELKDIQQDQNIEVQTEKINNDEYNNEENKTNTIIDENTNIDNEESEDKDNTTIKEVEDNNTKTEDVGKKSDTNTEKSDNKSEESTNLNKEKDKKEKKTKNPKTGDNIVVYGIFFAIALIGIAVIYKANKIQKY